MSKRANAARGQAAVEMALGTLVFVTVLVFAIHFSEVGFLSLKIQEASTAALWDTTQGSMHNMPWSYNQSGAINNAVSEVNARYADFDGRTSTSNGATIHNVFTSASNLQVNCSTGGVNDGSWMTVALTGVIYRPNGGMNCSAQADLSAYQMPTSFLENTKGFTFHNQNYAAQSTTLKICGVGRASGFNGPCNAKVNMLVDDWGLEGSGESSLCPIIQNPFIAAPCFSSNFMHYYTSVLWLYSASTFLGGVTTGASMAFALNILPGGTPVPALFAFPYQDEDALWMGFSGQDSALFQPGNFTQLLPMSWPLEGSPVYGLTPGASIYPTAAMLPPNYPNSFGSRQPCFLGQSCL